MSDSTPAQSVPPELVSDRPLGHLLRREARRTGLTALLTAAGLIVAVSIIAALRIDRYPPILNGLAAVLLLGVTGVGLSRLFQALAAIADQIDEHSKRLVEVQTAIREQSERFLDGSNGTGAEPPGALKPQRVAEIRLAIRNADWPEAEALLKKFAEAYPDVPETQKLITELSEAQTKAVQDVLSKIHYAREVGDHDRVIELREPLKAILKGDPLRDLDRDLARWFMLLIQKRLRTGTMRVDVAILAGRVAAMLDETPEGASLRASLPTLRRAAGLCPKCGQPYPGIADACPACISQALSHLPNPLATKSKSSASIPVITKEALFSEVQENA